MLAEDAFPSSPPLRAAQSPPGDEAMEGSPEGHSRPFTLKRGFSSSSWMAADDPHHPSSDPPAFSSEDGPDASIDDYAAPRKRRQHRGTWWDSAVTPFSGQVKSTKKGGFKRNLDSGIWLGSDGTADSDINNDDDGKSASSDCKPNRTPDREPETKLRSLYQRVHSTPESKLRAIVINACDIGTASVDLARLGLTKIEDSDLALLQSIVRPVPEQGIPDYFTPLAPDLKIYLSYNLLSQLPGQICRLENLTVLSVMNNNLTELPSSIGGLRNLKELNVSSNRLRWLPWELLRLLGPGGHLKLFTYYGNPFVSGISNTCRIELFSEYLTVWPRWNAASIEYSLEKLNDQWSQESQLAVAWIIRLVRSWQYRATTQDGWSTYTLARANPSFIATSPVTFFDGLGLHSPNSAQPICSVPEDMEVIQSTTSLPSHPDKGHRNVLSLFELSLRSFAFPSNISNHRKRTDPHASKKATVALDREAMTNSLPPIASLAKLIPQSFPPHILSAARSADTARTAGAHHSRCSVCLSSFVLPATEWIEFWWPESCIPCLRGDATAGFQPFTLPFLRRGCSPACGPWNRPDEEMGEIEYQAGNVTLEELRARVEAEAEVDSSDESPASSLAEGATD